MPYLQIRRITYASLNFRYFKLLWVIRIITTIFPLIGTYLFSRVVASLETKAPIKTVLLILFIGLMLQLLDNLFRLYSKTRLEYCIRKLTLDIQNNLLTSLPEKLKVHKDIIQACINLSLSVEKLRAYLKETGITGLIYFVSIPVILFFIDIKIFLIEFIFILIYLGFTIVFEKKYEKLYEIYNGSCETYYGKLFALKNYKPEQDFVNSRYNINQQFVFYMWSTFQNLVAVFQFVIPLIVAIDILNGTKHISDLVLIVGYTKESQAFLNEFSSTYERLMEIVAGIKRLERDTLIQNAN